LVKQPLIDQSKCQEATLPHHRRKQMFPTLEGGHRCMNCDKSCKKCLDQGNENCVECADGYKRSGEDRVCVKDKNKDKILTLENARYFTYGGLCIATGQEISEGYLDIFDLKKKNEKFI
jgi:hypothetical protein